MEREAYWTREWRDLPRDGECIVAFLFGRMAGPCGGPNHRHHVDPEDPTSRTLEVCATHHPRLQAALRHLHDRPKWRTCRHEHRYPGAKAACEARLNGVPAAA